MGKARKVVRSFLSTEFEFLRVVARKDLSELMRRRVGLLWIDCTFGSAIGHAVGLNAYKHCLFLGNGSIMYLEAEDDIEKILNSLEIQMGYVFLIVRKNTLVMSKRARKAKRKQGQLLDLPFVW